MNIKIEGKEFHANDGDTILDVARRNNIQIPTICYLSGCSPTLACKMCMVEVNGKRVYSCNAKVKDGMEVVVHNDELRKDRNEIMTTYCVNHPLECGVCDKSGECELQDFTLYTKVETQQFGLQEADKKSYSFAQSFYDPALCIMCERCVTTCKDNIGEANLKAGKANLFTPDNYKDSMGKDPYSVWAKRQKGLIEFVGKNECKDCGECISVCPVGAMTYKDFTYTSNAWELEKVHSTCSHCAGGCELIYNVKHLDVKGDLQKVYRVQNDFLYNPICGAGRFAFDMVSVGSRDLRFVLDAFRRADCIYIGSGVSNEEAFIANLIAKKLNIALINNEARNIQIFQHSFIQASKLYESNKCSESEGYFATFHDIKEAPLIISLDSYFKYDAPSLRYKINNNLKMLKNTQLLSIASFQDNLLQSLGKGVQQVNVAPQNVAIAGILGLVFANDLIDDFEEAFPFALNEFMRKDRVSNEVIPYESHASFESNASCHSEGCKPEESQSNESQYDSKNMDCHATAYAVSRNDDTSCHSEGCKPEESQSNESQYDSKNMDCHATAYAVSRNDGGGALSRSGDKNNMESLGLKSRNDDTSCHSDLERSEREESKNNESINNDFINKDVSATPQHDKGEVQHDKGNGQHDKGEVQHNKASPHNIKEDSNNKSQETKEEALDNLTPYDLSTLLEALNLQDLKSFEVSKTCKVEKNKDASSCKLGSIANGILIISDHTIQGFLDGDLKHSSSYEIALNHSVDKKPSILEAVSATIAEGITQNIADVLLDRSTKIQILAHLLAFIAQKLCLKLLYVPKGANTLGVANLCELTSGYFIESQYSIGIRTKGHFVLNSNLETINPHFPLPTLAQSEGSITSMEMRLLPLNPSIPYLDSNLESAFDLSDIAKELGVFDDERLQNTDYIGDFTQYLGLYNYASYGYKDIGHERLKAHFERDGKDNRGYFLKALESDIRQGRLDMKFSLRLQEPKAQTDMITALLLENQNQFSPTTLASKNLQSKSGIYANKALLDSLGLCEGDLVSVGNERGEVSSIVYCDYDIVDSILLVSPLIAGISSIFKDSFYTSLRIRKQEVKQDSKDENKAQTLESIEA